MEIQFLLAFTLLSLYASGVKSAKFTIKNNCPFTVWPGTLSAGGQPQLSSTGFELARGATFSLDAPGGWSGRIWGRTDCTPDLLGNVTCLTGDCGSGQVTCNGGDATQPASVAELTLDPHGGKDFYDINLVDGFNLPMSLTPQGGHDGCTPISCSNSVNAVCPTDFAVILYNGTIIACKSDCLTFNTPEDCCTGDFNDPNKCKPGTYSQIVKRQCPQAYSYAYDLKTGLFTCIGGPNYAITFCP